MPLFQRKKGEDSGSSSVQPIGFEVKDKPTPLAGKILLFIMALLLIYLGQNALRDVKNIYPKPKPLSSCTSYYVLTAYGNSPILLPVVSTPSNFTDMQRCVFTDIEQKHNIPRLYAALETARVQYDVIQSQKKAKETQLYSVESQIKQKQKEYDLSLQEKMAEQSESAYDPEQLKSAISLLEQQKRTLQGEITQLETLSVKEASNFADEEADLKSAAEKASADYKRANAWYEFMAFVLQLLFTLPLFILFAKLYFREKKKDSPYTLIFTTLLGVSGLLFAQVAVTYLWDAFLARLVEIIWEFIKNIAIFRTLVYYIGMFFVILVFGGTVYSLQKKIFAEDRVKKRRLRKGQCPHCELPLRFSKKHCPSCGKDIKRKCAQCGKLRYVDFAHCPYCSSK